MRTDTFKLVIALGLVVAGIFGMMSGGAIEREPGVLAPDAPLQFPIEAARIAAGDFELQPQARYEIEARVLSVERYRTDGGARLSPIDFAVGWGPMSDSAVLAHFRVTQGGRFFTIYPDEQAIDLQTALVSAANMHLIPATSDVKDMLLRVRPGHIVHLRGFLVNASRPDGYHWNTSLTRTDSGAGACELFYVEYVGRR
ncbi:MAG: hypothetical protein ABW034_22415 [Steroidobacteraceae bacterium]